MLQVVEAMAEQENMSEKHRAELAELEDKWKGQVVTRLVVARGIVLMCHPITCVAQVADAMAEQESAIAEAVTELELSEERHREELVMMEAKWKTKVKTVSVLFPYIPFQAVLAKS